MKNLIIPISDDTIRGLSMGDMVSLSGRIFTARDAAHKRLAAQIEAGEKLPFNFNGEAVFYAGPSPARPGRVIGSIGPTTAGRMDLYAPLLISKGLKIMIGKGQRSREVVDAIVKYHGVFFAATGGIAALMAKCVTSARVIAYDDLGTEAIRELVVENLPLVVAIDSQGRDLYEAGRAKYQVVTEW